MTAGSAPRDRSGLWLPLLRELTERFPNWMAMKLVRSALEGGGDVDSLAPPEDWPGIQRTILEWAFAHDLGPVVTCDHGMFHRKFVALDPGSQHFFEVDLASRRYFLGATLFRPADLLPLSEVDPRGFRRIRPGADGLLKLFFNGTRRSGAPNVEGLRTKRIVELLQRDPEGARLAAKLFGPGAKPAAAAAEALVRGSWSRGSLLAVEASCVARSLTDPAALRARWRFGADRKRCPVLRACYETDRCVPGDRALWLTTVAATHQVFRADGGAPVAPRKSA